MHLFLDVKANGNIQLNFPELEPDEMAHSCALDLAEHENTLADVAQVLNVTRERCRQIEVNALVKLALGSAARLLRGERG